MDRDTSKWPGTVCVTLGQFAWHYLRLANGILLRRPYKLKTNASDFFGNDSKKCLRSRNVSNFLIRIKQVHDLAFFIVRSPMAATRFSRGWASKIWKIEGIRSDFSAAFKNNLGRLWRPFKNNLGREIIVFYSKWAPRPLFWNLTCE